MHQCLDILEEFIHAKDDLPPVVRAALTHYQFEAIHPFMDGNGRVGRVLIVMMLMQAGLLSQPNLYLSAFLEAHRQEYNDHLLAVSQAGDWVAWLQFFLRAVASQALDARQRLNALSQLRTTYENQLARDRAGDRLLRVVDLVFARRVVSVRQVGKELGVPFVSARRYVDRLVQDGILTEITGRRKDRLFRADEVVRIVTAPLVK
jgi:Fic family protein